tara:strand:+ start:412 stop:783 length:372 start_codon:yes stop_codon:yes gene_type:complete
MARKSTSKAKSVISEEVSSAADPECCKACDEEIAKLKGQISGLENKLQGLIAGIEAASKLKSELDEAKVKLGSEVRELQENAKSWVAKQKEAADTNNDGKVDFEEVYAYVFRRLRSRNRNPRK